MRRVGFVASHGYGSCVASACHQQHTTRGCKRCESSNSSNSVANRPFVMVACEQRLIGVIKRELRLCLPRPPNCVLKCWRFHFGKAGFPQLRIDVSAAGLGRNDLTGGQVRPGLDGVEENIQPFALPCIYLLNAFGQTLFLTPALKSIHMLAVHFHMPFVPRRAECVDRPQSSM